MMATGILIGALVGMAAIAVLSSLMAKDGAHIPHIEFKVEEVQVDRTDVVLEVDGLGVGFMAVVRHDGTHWISAADLGGTRNKSKAILLAKMRLLTEWEERVQA